MSFAAKRKKIQYKIKTNPSHCPTKTISKTDTVPLKAESIIPKQEKQREASLTRISEAASENKFPVPPILPLVAAAESGLYKLEKIKIK